MTPFGLKLRQMRAQKGITQKEMAADLGVSAAYLSALERGQRGVPTWDFIQRVIGYFNVIWDDAEELQKLARDSHPKVAVDTSELSAAATELANLFAGSISSLDEDQCKILATEIRKLTSSR